MKILFLLLSCLIINTEKDWLTNFEEAQKLAVQQNKYILLNFSGSDWCGPCIRMRKEIFEAGDFKSFSASHLILLNADFPRSKKNQLSKEQVKLNEAIAEKYNHDGKFPYTVLLNPAGKVVKTWDGFPDETPAEFIKETKILCESSK